jgi:glyoxylase-like metal-dependent hydrolase (beta-lactamase superfamily II)
MKIKQIKIGFAESDKKTWIRACSSVTLIQDGKQNILVDVGGRGYHKEIAAELEKEKLAPEDISYIVLTHEHQDHTFNAAFYEHAQIISFKGVLTDRFTWHKLPININKNVEVMHTPGHSNDSCSVIAQSKKGIYAIVGDLFYSNQDKIPSFEKNIERILKERDRIIGIADHIIPGHGEMFKVRK